MVTDGPGRLGQHGGHAAVLRAAFLRSPLATLVVSPAGRVVAANPAFETVLGGPAAPEGTDLVDLVAVQDRHLLTVELAARDSGRDTGVVTCRLVTATGEHRWTRVTWSMVPVDGGGGPAGAVRAGEVRHAVLHVADVEVEARAALVSDELLAAVEAERSVLDAALEASPDGLSLFHAHRDEDGVVVDARLVRMSRAGAAGRPLERLTGRSMREYFPEAEQTGLHAATMAAFRTQQTQRVLVEVGPDGSWPGVFENVIVPIDADRALCTFRDVTRERRDEQRLLHAATHDALTGLPNRVLLRDRIERALRRGQREGGAAVTIAFLDLDGFKLVNDTRGHRFGDEVLRQVADRLSASVREQDTVARLGGDEFVLVLEGCADLGGWQRAYERMSRALAAPMQVDGHEVSLRASTGVVLVPAGEVDADAVMRNADIAMYASKNGGKARYTVFTEEHRRAVLDQATLEDDLRTAVAERQFVLHRQPIVDVATDAVVGHEVLLRWQHPVRGLLGPTAFLPALESGGHMVDVGAWLVREALTRSGSAAGMVTINVAVQQLVRSDFTATVRDALAATSTPAGSLVVEITESQMLPSGTGVLGQLEELRALGVRVAVDDFGTGYSSLSHLADLPVDIVKVDGSFLVGAEDPRRVAVLRSAVELTTAVGAECLVEGVETRHHLDLVRATGARYAQGFLLGRPTPM